MPEPHQSPASKKEQIMALYASGVHEPEDLAAQTGASASYVSNILRQAGAQAVYFDLYTPTRVTMNTYTRLFAGHLGYKDEATARSSAAYLEEQYEAFEKKGDRAGQHHTLVMALTMLNRARWSGKTAEGEVFRQWLQAKLV